MCKCALRAEGAMCKCENGLRIHIWVELAVCKD